jgi:hypothetical protein
LLADIGFHDPRYALNFDTTVTMDLGFPEDELLAKMRKSTRYGVRKAAREDVEVVEPEDFEAGWETFYGWMGDTAERKSGFTRRRPREYLHDMLRTMHETGQGHLFLAVHEDTPLVGVLVFYLRREVLVHARGLEHREAQLQPQPPPAMGGNALGQRARAASTTTIWWASPSQKTATKPTPTTASTGSK